MGSVQRVQLAPGFVLHQRAYRDTSALVELFTRDYGRITVVARGVRSAKSRLRAELQPFQSLLLSWQLRGELGTLSGAECQGGRRVLSGDALYGAYYLNELLMRLLVKHDPHSSLYKDYVKALEGLANTDRIEAVLRVFEKHLLEELGYGLVLECDVADGEAVIAEQYYDYQLEAGPVRNMTGQTSGFVFSGKSLLQIADENFDDDKVLQDSKRLMRAALRLYLGDKPLKTRELLLQMKG